MEPVEKISAGSIGFMDYQIRERIEKVAVPDSDIRVSA